MDEREQAALSAARVEATTIGYALHGCFARLEALPDPVGKEGLAEALVSLAVRLELVPPGQPHALEDLSPLFSPSHPRVAGFHADGHGR